MNGISRSIARAAGLGLVAGGVGLAVAQSPAGGSADPVAPSINNNFGYPIGFSVEKMDPKADPRRDFRRYAAGRWTDAAVIPADSLRVSGIDVLKKQVEVQIGTLLDEAARASATAARGSPTQQVGDFYASGMNERRLAELGVAPIKPDLARIAAIDGRKSLAEALARLAVATNDPVLIGAIVGTDTVDRRRYTIYVGDSDLPLGTDNYLKPEFEKIREGYLRQVADYLIIAGSTSADAKSAAQRILAIETRIAAKKLTPVEQRDPAKRFQKMRYDDLKAMVGNVDLDAYFGALGLPTGGEVIVVEAAALRERNALLAELPLADTKVYLDWELVRRAAPYLTPAFLVPGKAFAEVLYGKFELPPRDRLVAQQISGKLGHPLGQLYVARYLSPDAIAAAEDLVARIKSEFRGRVEKSRWVAHATRREALAKFDTMKVGVGRPAQWIDYAAVEIRRDDYFGNVARINEFRVRRELARFGKPVQQDGFAVPNATQPTDINAAYQPDKNSIEIPAAFLQPPFYDPKADPALNFCSLGAVIGHEFTHGFDSSGRLYDSQGNVRDWWTAADAKHFEQEAQKLVRQASAVEILPGLHINGQLSVGENLADVGGVSLGAAALKRYLHDHPQQNRKIDGLTQTQRCYLAWAQAWADKANEGWLRQVLPVDGHPPGVYRMLAPAQHERSFYEAFGIRAGDPAWLDPKNRVALW